MKKLLLGFLLFIFHFSLSTAQTWDSLGSGIPGFARYSFGVFALAEYNGNLVAGGVFDSAGALPVNNVAEWNGLEWDSLGTGVQQVSPSGGSIVALGIYSEMLYDGNLCFGGGFYLPSVDRYGIAQWNGVDWDSVGSETYRYTTIYALQIFNNSLYTAGGGAVHLSGGKPCYGIARWNGISWDSVSNGTQGTIYALTVYNGELYAAGSFDSIGHIYAKNIAKWNDTNWSLVGLGIDSIVYSLATYNGKLYAGGYFKNAGSVPAKNIAVWNDTNWNSVGAGVTCAPMYSGVYALYQYGSILCVGGQFDSAGNQPANNIAYWDGTNWGTLGSGISGTDAFVETFCTYNGALIVGGQFSNAGGVPAKNIAEWRSPLGISEVNSNSGKLKVFPNPNNGTFTLSLSNINEKSNIKIYNVFGEKVLTETLRSAQGDNLINLDGQPPAVCFYRVLEEDGSIIGDGKIVVE